jgi:hypothetical protein
MKKVLSTVAAFGLVAGLATGAAALELKVKGEYIVDGFYVDNGGYYGGTNPGAAPTNGDGGSGFRLASDYTNPATPDNESHSDSWLQHVFNLEAEMVVNDKISMKSRIRLVDDSTVWGTQDDRVVKDGGNMSIERLWMVYKSPIGIWEIGRRPAGAWGLSFLDNVYGGDRIYWNSGKLFGEQFTAYAFFEKLTEGEAYQATTDDMDSDYYELCGSMQGGWGKATLAYGLKLDDTKNGSSTPGVVATGDYEDTVNRIKGVGQFKIGANMGFDTEFDYLFGERDYILGTVADRDISQFAFIADFNAKIEALTGHAMYFFVSGDDNSADNDLESYGNGKAGSGGDFEPLYILTGSFGNILNSDQGAANPWGDAAKLAGANAFIFTADYAVNQDLTLHAGLGYALAAKELAGWDDSYGVEYNVGGAYKLVDNLVYAIHLGYLDTGDFFTLGTLFRDVDSVFLASHHLTMSF